MAVGNGPGHSTTLALMRFSEFMDIPMHGEAGLMTKWTVGIDSHSGTLYELEYSCNEMDAFLVGRCKRIFAEE